MSDVEKTCCDQCGEPFDDEGPAGGYFEGGKSLEFCGDCMGYQLSQLKIRTENSCSEWSDMADPGMN
jgi:hypothetical protein